MSVDTQEYIEKVLKRRNKAAFGYHMSKYIFKGLSRASLNLDLLIRMSIYFIPPVSHSVYMKSRSWANDCIAGNHQFSDTTEGSDQYAQQYILWSQSINRDWQLTKQLFGSRYDLMQNTGLKWICIEMSLRINWASINPKFKNICS